MSNTTQDQLGVGNLKQAGTIVMNTITNAAKQFGDGVQAKDFIALIPDAMNAAANAAVFQNVGAEVKDGLTTTQRYELIVHLKQEFIKAELGFKNEAFIDQIVDAVADAVISVLKVIYLFKNKPA